MMSEREENSYLTLFSKIINQSWIFQYVFSRNFVQLAVFLGISVLLFPGFRISKCLYFKIKKAIFGNTTLEEDITVKFPNFAFYKNFIKSRPNGKFFVFFLTVSPPNKMMMPLRHQGLMRVKGNEKTSLRRKDYKRTGFRNTEGDSIENILTQWKGNNYILETNHSYIQWLFPNRMPGVNREASVLKNEEAEVIRCSPELRERVKRAFEMMLEFYGMRLTSDNKFEHAKNSKERLTELNNWNNHNFLRISRILLALKELGHQELMLPWMKFLAELIYKEKVLTCAESSFENYWLETLDAEDKIAVVQYKNTLIQSKDTIQ